MMKFLKESVQGKGIRIVFTEGEDKRIQEAAQRLHEENMVVPVLLGNADVMAKVASENGFKLDGIECIDPETADIEEMVTKMVELRKGKMTEEQCRELLKKGNYFGTMYVKMGFAAGLLGGATYTTADTVRPALQLIKTKPGNSIVSSVFMMLRGEETYGMADCAINIDPSADELAEIATQTAHTCRQFGMDPKVAMLSYSSFGSGKGPSVDKVREASDKLKAMDLDFAVDGEMQFDAAFSAEVGKLKAPNSKVAGEANVFVFPDINAGNIGYKIAARLGGFEAVGPILQGLNNPTNDLSRGCNADEVYAMAIVTAAQDLME